MVEALAVNGHRHNSDHLSAIPATRSGGVREVATCEGPAEPTQNLHSYQSLLSLKIEDLESDSTDSMLDISNRYQRSGNKTLITWHS